MMRASIVLAWLTLLALPAATAAAQRSDFPEAPHFAAKLMLGVAGEAEFEGGVPILPLTGSIESDMELTWGAGVHYLHPLVKYFAIGGQVALQSWQAEWMDDYDVDSNLWLDLAVMPAGTFPVSDKVQIYVALPLGLSFDFWDEDPPGGEVDTAVGFTIALLGGVRFALGDSFGLLAELGYVAHSFEHEIDPSVGNLTREFDVDVGQLAINLGAFF